MENINIVGVTEGNPVGAIVGGTSVVGSVVTVGNSVGDIVGNTVGGAVVGTVVVGAVVGTTTVGTVVVGTATVGTEDSGTVVGAAVGSKVAFPADGADEKKSVGTGVKVSPGVGAFVKLVPSVGSGVETVGAFVGPFDITVGAMVMIVGEADTKVGTPLAMVGDAEPTAGGAVTGVGEGVATVGSDVGLGRASNAVQTPGGGGPNIVNWVHPAESPISKAGYTEQLLVKEIAKKPTIGWPAAFNANVFT